MFTALLWLSKREGTLHYRLSVSCYSLQWRYLRRVPRVLFFKSIIQIIILSEHNHRSKVLHGAVWITKNALYCKSLYLHAEHECRCRGGCWWLPKLKAAGSGAQVLPARQGPCPEGAGEAALGGPGHRQPRLPGHHSQDRRDPSQGPERQLCGGAGHTRVPDHCQDEHGLLQAGL